MGNVRNKPQKQSAANPISLKTSAGLVLACLVVAYLLGSWALDSGSWWLYAATAATVWLAGRTIILAVKHHGN